MANSNTPIFAVGNYDSIAPAIASGTLKYPSYVFCKDKDILVFIDSDLNMREIKGYHQENILYVDALPDADIREDVFYIYKGMGYLYLDGTWTPMFQESGGVTSYNSLDDIPIINEYGTVANIINLFDLDNGLYSVSGNYQICDGDTVYITSRHVLFSIDANDENKYITKFGTGEITLYTINLGTGKMSADNYVTEQWVREQKYLTEEDLEGISDEFIASLF